MAKGFFVVLMVLGTMFSGCIFRRKGTEEYPAEMSQRPVFSDGSYRDSLIEIGGGKIVFKNYYFPTGAKTVDLSNVEYVIAKPCTLRNGRWRLHGTGDLLFRIWFPADYGRPDRNRIFVMKIKGKWVKIGFTVENSEAVCEFFRSEGLLREQS